MAFSDFDLETACEKFSLTTDEKADLFASVLPLEVSPRLRDLLDEWAPIALAINTEKARSEMIITPILLEAVRLAPPPVSVFSGVPFDVDKERGLNDACDYLLTRSSERYFVRRPVVTVVEAKKEDMVAGLGQCVAAMVAVQLFNQRGGGTPFDVYGAVTTGTNWRFLKLTGSKVFIDEPEYYLQQLGAILGILVLIVTQASPTN